MFGPFDMFDLDGDGELSGIEMGLAYSVINNEFDNEDRKRGGGCPPYYDCDICGRCDEYGQCRYYDDEDDEY